MSYDIQELKQRAKEHLAEYVQKTAAGQEIDLGSLSDDINELIKEFSSEGIDIFSDDGIFISEVQIQVNSFGVVLINFK